MRKRDLLKRQKNLESGAIDEMINMEAEVTRSRRNPEPHEEVTEAMTRPPKSEQDTPQEELVFQPTEFQKSRVLIVERAGQKFRITVPVDLEITFSVVSGRRENRYGPDEHGRDLRFYKDNRKILVGALTAVTDVYEEGVLQIEQWNPKLTKKSTHTEDNSSSKSSNETTIAGDWEPVPFSMDKSSR